MPRIQLAGGAYTNASLIANAQRSVNLYAEHNAPQSSAPVQVTHYPRPGLTPLSAPPAPAFGRCLYTATNGDLYAVVGQTLYYIDPNWVWAAIGQLQSPPSATPAYIADNGVNGILVDGSPFGINITLANRTAAGMGDPNFFGGNRIGFINYFLVLNEIGTPNWYSSPPTEVGPLNALAFGSLTQWPGNCVALIAIQGAVMLFSQQKAEIWANAGTVPFSFQPIPGTIIEQGLVAIHSLCSPGEAAYWVSQSIKGARMAMQGVGTSAKRISNHAIEEEWLKYARVDDCIGQCYQIRGHNFVLFHFPTADRTWCYDEGTNEWHEEAYFDFNGIQHRTLDTMMTYAYGKNLSLDFATGQLYQRDETNFSDNGISIHFIRSMPHIMDDEDDRLTLWRVIADMECGNGPGVPTPTEESPWSLGFSNGFGPQILVEPPYVTLRISHDRGFSYITHSMQPMGSQGQYNKRPTFNRCGEATDFVCELSWSGPLKSALNGVFVTIEKHEADE